jgi:hypothetical protein
MRFTLAAIVLAFSTAARAADPLDFVPAQARLVVKVENPRKLADALTTLDAYKSARELTAFQNAYDTTTARRLYQMLGYVERELGAKWPALLEQLGGNGVVIASTLGDDNAPALLVMQGTDEKQVAKGFELIFKVIEEELTRQGAKERPARGTHGAVEVIHFGDFHLARVGKTVLVSNKVDGLKAAVMLGTGGDKTGGVLSKKSLAAAKKLLPADPLAWLWLDFAAIKESKASKDFFEATRQDFLQTLVVGSTIDCLRRSDFVAVGLYAEPSGVRVALRVPAGRDKFPPEFAFHVPPKGEPGSLPMLEPPGVIYSQSMHLDIGYYWKNRDKLINEEMRKQFEEGEKQLSKVIPGSVKFGQLLEMWGPHHRLVVVNHDQLPYKIAPTNRYPAFGYVATMRDKKFGASAESLIRSGGLIASLQFGMKSAEQDFDGVKIVGYRFNEAKPLDGDPENTRFNFEPCFAIVGDEFISATTFEVCKKLITEVKRTAKLPGSDAVWRNRGYAAGAADALAALPDPLVTDAILGQGVGIEVARKQVAELVKWLRTLGTARVEIDERDTEYRLDVVWTNK